MDYFFKKRYFSRFINPWITTARCNLLRNVKVLLIWKNCSSPFYLCLFTGRSSPLQYGVVDVRTSGQCGINVPTSMMATTTEVMDSDDKNTHYSKGCYLQSVLFLPLLHFYHLARSLTDSISAAVIPSLFLFSVPYSSWQLVLLIVTMREEGCDILWQFRLGTVPQFT